MKTQEIIDRIKARGGKMMYGEAKAILEHYGYELVKATACKNYFKKYGVAIEVAEKNPIDHDTMLKVLAVHFSEL